MRGARGSQAGGGVCRSHTGTSRGKSLTMRMRIALPRQKQNIRKPLSSILSWGQETAHTRDGRSLTITCKPQGWGQVTSYVPVESVRLRDRAVEPAGCPGADHLEQEHNAVPRLLGDGQVHILS